MATRYSVDSIPHINDKVIKSIVRLYFTEKTISENFEITFESGKNTTTHGWSEEKYGKPWNVEEHKKNTKFMPLYNAINTLDLEKYADKRTSDFYDIPIEIYVEMLEKNGL